MFDPRIYRAALLPAVAAFVLLMFSLEPIPSALQQPVSTPTYDASDAARTTRSIVAEAPDRTPGSDGDATTAELVRQRFSEIEGGEVSVQDFDSTYSGDDVNLQNVLLTLPGSSEQTLLVVADRDSTDGPGAASSAAATATLINIADSLGGSRHKRTIVLASTDGGGDGEEGARELIDGLPRTDDIGAAIVISQPGARDPRPPFVISSGTGPESPSTQLVQTARTIAASSFDQRDPAPGPWVGLSRLAVPMGLGEQAALRDQDIEAIAISSAGERALPADSRDAEAANTDTLGESGTAVLDLLLTLDDADAAPISGPDDYIRLGDNLIPGWTLSLLGLMLLLAPLLAAADTWLREFRIDWRTRRSAFWVIERAVPPVAALLMLYLLALVGLVPTPGFPYDPARFPAGTEAPIAFGVLAAAFVLAGLLIRPMRTPLDIEPHTLAAAAGILSGFALLGIWLLNPYLALLLAPAAHVWLLPARAAGPPRTVLVAAVAIVSLAGAIAAFMTVTAQLDLGASGPWNLLLMIVDGQIGPVMSMLWCGLIGGLIACVAAAGSAGRMAPPITAAPIRGAGSHVGPGSLGATPSSLPRR
jgi:hypothetical protein